MISYKHRLKKADEYVQNTKHFTGKHMGRAVGLYEMALDAAKEAYNKGKIKIEDVREIEKTIKEKEKKIVIDTECNYTLKEIEEFYIDRVEMSQVVKAVDEFPLKEKVIPVWIKKQLRPAIIKYEDKILRGEELTPKEEQLLKRAKKIKEGYLDAYGVIPKKELIAGYIQPRVNKGTRLNPKWKKLRKAVEKKQD